MHGVFEIGQFRSTNEKEPDQNEGLTFSDEFKKLPLRK